MLISNKVVKNAAWIIGCRIFQSVLALIISMLTARYLGPSNFGIINYAASLVAFVAPLAHFSIGSIAVHELVLTPEKEGQILGTSIGISMVGSAACMAGLVSFAAVMNRGDTVTVVVCALYSISLVSSAMEMIQYWFQAKLISKYASVVSLIAYALVSAYKIFLLVTGKSVYWFAVSHAIDYFLIAVALIVIYKRLNGRRLSFSWTLLKKLLNKSKYYMLSDVMVVTFAHMDKILLQTMMDNEAVGYYSAAVACAGVTSFVFKAILDSFRPSVLESKEVSEEKFEQNVKLLYTVIIYASLLQCIFMCVFSKLVVRILYGAAYAPSATVLRIVVWYTTFSYLGSARNIWLLAEKKQKYLWIINMSGAILNVSLNILFINLFGIIGAAITALITQIFTNVMIGFIIKPIRRNNLLMLRALNPKQFLPLISYFRSKRMAKKG